MLVAAQALRGVLSLDSGLLTKLALEENARIMRFARELRDLAGGPTPWLRMIQAADVLERVAKGDPRGPAVNMDVIEAAANDLERMACEDPQERPRNRRERRAAAACC